MHKKILMPLLLIFLLGSVMASFSWADLFKKNQICDILNITDDLECDAFWCEGVHEGDYNKTRELCVFIINETIIVNATNQTQTNVTINATNFYNKSDIDDMLGDVKMNFSQRYVLQDDFEVFKGKLDKKESGEGGITTTDLVIGILIVIVIVGGIYFVNKGKQQRTPEQRGVAQTEIPKIQSKQEKEKDYDMKQILERLDKMEKGKSEKTQGKKTKKQITKEEIPEEQP